MFFLYRHHARFIQKIVVTFFSCTGLVNFQLLAAPPSQQISSFHTESCECSVYPSRTNIMHLPPILPPLICNGGDGRDSAYPVGRTGIEGLSAGDTVARYRRDEDSDLNDINAARSSRIARTNCECIYAPRFGSVRNVTRLHEESVPQGPAGVSSDKSLASQTILQPPGNAAQLTSLQMARKSKSGLAVEERSGPLGVDAAMLPNQSLGQAKAGERVYDTHVKSADKKEPIAESVGIDIPIAWTRLTAANAVFNDQKADITSASQGIATLRVESLGRAELTLCKRSGSDSARIGEEIDFTIAFLNSGDVPLTDIVIMDVLPQRLKLIESSPAASLPSDIKIAPAADGTTSISWQLESPLKAGQSGFVRMRTVVQ